MKVFPRITVLMLALSIVQFTNAQPNRNKEVGFDNTYWKVQRSLYEWSDQKKTTEKTFAKPDKDIWFYKDTSPRSGYVELKDGTRIEGSFSKRYHYNKSSTYKVTVDGVKKDNPDGKFYYEARIREKGEDWETYELAQLVSYGIDYQISDIENGDFKNGSITLKNGLTLSGLFWKIFWNSPYEGFKYYGQFLYAEDESSAVIKIQSDQVEEAIIDDELLLEMSGWMVSPENFKTTFSDKASDIKFKRLKPGTVSLQDGTVHEGMIALQDRKKMSKGFFISNDETYLIELSAYNAGLIVMDSGLDYASFQGSIRSMGDVQKKWSKSGDLKIGKIAFANGSMLEGKIGFQRLQNAVKSYRWINGVYYFPSDGSIGYLFGPESGIDFVEHSGTKYVPVGKYFEDYNSFVQKLRSKNSEILTENLNPGYLMMKDGTKKEGQVAATKDKVSFIGAGNDLEQFSAYQDKIDHYVQVINGQSRKFVSMKRRSKGFGGNRQYVEIIQYDKAFSYYKNPYPTHLRKGITNIGGGIIEASIDEASTELAEEAAKQSAKNEYKNSGDLGKTAQAANESYTQTKQAFDGITVGDEGGVFFEEYILTNNETGKQYVVYKRNDREIMGQLLSSCPVYQQFKERDQKRVTRMENIAEAVRLLNSCKAN